MTQTGASWSSLALSTTQVMWRKALPPSKPAMWMLLAGPEPTLSDSDGVHGFATGDESEPRKHNK